MIDKIKKKLIEHRYITGLNKKRSKLYNGQNGDILKSFKHKYKGQRCFIIGNGPSLNIDDLNKLKGEITFAFNRIYYIFDKTDWRPSYYFTEDIKIIKQSLDEINNLNLDYIFTPDIINFDYNMKIKNAIYFKQVMEEFKDTLPQFSDEFFEQSYWGGTVAYTAMQMAVYMGFKEIYLIGVDHSFRVSQDSNGNIKVDNSVKDYFCGNYNSDKDELYIPNLDNSTKAYMAARKYCDEHDVTIYNATRGGKLEVFERVDFDKLFD